MVRFSIPDSAGGGGPDSSLNIYVNGTLHKAIPLNSKYAWLYGAEASPSNSPGSGGPRHIYDEANIMLNSSIPAGATIKLQKDSGQRTEATVDFVNLEQVAPRANPDPARYKVPAGTSQQDVQAALRRGAAGHHLARRLPAGGHLRDQQQVHRSTAAADQGGRRRHLVHPVPDTAGQENTNAGFDVQSSASGSSFEHLAFFGNYTSRQDGPGKVWGELHERRQHDDRQRLGRAHGLRLLGRQRRAV